MDLSLETFLKTDPRDRSEEIGPTIFAVDEDAYLELVEHEEALKNSSAREVHVPIDEASVDVNAPVRVGCLKDQKLRIFLDNEGKDAHVHLVAKRASDEALVYTEPAMIKLIAI